MRTVVEVLAAHRRCVLLGVVRCACGWAEPPIAHRSGTDSYERHVADALATAGALIDPGVSAVQLDAVRMWCDLADERGDGKLHTSTVRLAMDAAAAGLGGAREVRER